MRLFLVVSSFGRCDLGHLLCPNGSGRGVNNTSFEGEVSLGDFIFKDNHFKIPYTVM